MSYTISLFVEKRNKGAKEWHLVGSTYLIDNCKFILVHDNDEMRFSDDIVDDFYDVPDEEPVSDGLLHHYDNDLKHYCVKVCSLDEYQTRINTAIRSFNDTMKMCYKALGISCNVNEDEWRILDTYAEDNKKYTSSGDIRKGYSQLTFPVDKDLMEELNDKTELFSKAMIWRGIFMCIDVDWDEECRLVFVRDF